MFYKGFIRGFIYAQSKIKSLNSFNGYKKIKVSFVLKKTTKRRTWDSLKHKSFDWIHWRNYLFNFNTYQEALSVTRDIKEVSTGRKKNLTFKILKKIFVAEKTHNIFIFSCRKLIHWKIKKLGFSVNFLDILVRDNFRWIIF